MVNFTALHNMASPNGVVVVDLNKTTLDFNASSIESKSCRMAETKSNKLVGLIKTIFELYLINMIV